MTKATLGRILLSQGRTQAAIEVLAPVLAACRTTLGDSHQATLLAMNNYGKALALDGRHGEARPLLEAAVDGLRLKNTRRDWVFLRFALNLAETYVALGEQILGRNIFSQDLAWLLQKQIAAADVQKALDYERVKKLAAAVGDSEAPRSTMSRTGG
jgi:hypothetical protein